MSSLTFLCHHTIDERTMRDYAATIAATIATTVAASAPTTPSPTGTPA
ncbi:MAG: hypothetical protein O2855_09200 [Planctomycetota bacterium]|nr:hypothetical protein [Planctomycetota bacterium]